MGQEIKKVTQENVDEILKLYEESDAIANDVSDSIKSAKHNEHNEIEVERKDGKKVKISEKLAWEEIYQLGKISEAYDVIRAKYPDTFTRSEMHLAKVKEINSKAFQFFGIESATRMTLRDIITIVVALKNIK